MIGSCGRRLPKAAGARAAAVLVCSGCGSYLSEKELISANNVEFQGRPGGAAAPAWVADVNARGGLAGHPVQLITADDRGDPSQAVSLARRLVEQDGVIAFFGLPDPTTAQAILAYLETKGVPAIGSCI